jgi:hypothetical protein
MNNIDHDRNDTSTMRQGVNAQTGVLTDVPPGRPDHFRWLALNSISTVNQANQEQTRYHFD